MFLNLDRYSLWYSLKSKMNCAFVLWAVVVACHLRTALLRMPDDSMTCVVCSIHQISVIAPEVPIPVQSQRHCCRRGVLHLPLLLGYPPHQMLVHQVVVLE